MCLRVTDMGWNLASKALILLQEELLGLYLTRKRTEAVSAACVCRYNFLKNYVRWESCIIIIANTCTRIYEEAVSVYSFFEYIFHYRITQRCLSESNWLPGGHSLSTSWNLFELIRIHSRYFRLSPGIGNRPSPLQTNLHSDVLVSNWSPSLHFNTKVGWSRIQRPYTFGSLG
jgi:hypothetical protein